MSRGSSASQDVVQRPRTEDVADEISTPQDASAGADGEEVVDAHDAGEEVEVLDVSTPPDVAAVTDTGDQTDDASSTDALDAQDGAVEADAQALVDVSDSGATPVADTSPLDVGGTSDGSEPDASVDVEELDAGEGDWDVETVGVVDAVLLVDAAEDVVDTGDATDSGGVADVLVDVEEPVAGPLYLLSINNSTHTLEKIDVATGAGTDVCQLSTAYSYPSLTFSRDNVLFASRSGNTLDAIDPCTCQVSTIGPYNGFSGVNGITSDFGLNLFGVSHIQDQLITINTSTGSGTSVGPLGVDFGYTGATWSEDEQLVYAIDASSDALYVIAPDTGEASFVAPLSLPMGTVGIEMHPANGLLYACSDPSHLLQIDLVTGDVTDIGDMGQNTACNNLAAPWKTVECLEGL